MEEEKDNQIYELAYHLLPSVAEEEVPALGARLGGLVTEQGGNIISEGAPAMKSLAYEIIKKTESKSLKFSKAYFGWIKFEAPKTAVATIDKALKGEGQVLRFLIVKTVRENTAYVPKAPMFKKDRKPEEKSPEATDQPKVSKEAIDKSIDELLVNKTL